MSGTAILASEIVDGRQIEMRVRVNELLIPGVDGPYAAVRFELVEDGVVTNTVSLITNRTLFQERVEVDRGGMTRALIDACTAGEAWADFRLHNHVFPRVRVYAPDDPDFQGEVHVMGGGFRVPDGGVVVEGGGVEVWLPPDSRRASAPAEDWPEGVSFMRTSSVSGYPEWNGVVKTVRSGSNARTFQEFTAWVANDLPERYVRVRGTGSTWGGWRKAAWV